MKAHRRGQVINASSQPNNGRITEHIAVSGLDCADCGADMRNAVRQLVGVQAVAVNVNAQQISVTFDPTRTNVPAIRAHMETVGIGCR